MVSVWVVCCFCCSDNGGKRRKVGSLNEVALWNVTVERVLGVGGVGSVPVHPPQGVLCRSRDRMDSCPRESLPWSTNQAESHSLYRARSCQNGHLGSSRYREQSLSKTCWILQLKQLVPSLYTLWECHPCWFLSESIWTQPSTCFLFTSLLGRPERFRVLLLLFPQCDLLFSRQG